jgi:hypothetical protein
MPGGQQFTALASPMLLSGLLNNRTYAVTLTARHGVGVSLPLTVPTATTTATATATGTGDGDDNENTNGAVTTTTAATTATAATTVTPLAGLPRAPAIGSVVVDDNTGETVINFSPNDFGDAFTYEAVATASPSSSPGDAIVTVPSPAAVRQPPLRFSAMALPPLPAGGVYTFAVRAIDR